MTWTNSDRCRCRLCACRYRLGSQIGAEQPKVRHLGALLGEARSSPGERGPQGSQRAPDVDLVVDERRLGGAQIRQILREGSGASQETPWSQKGTPETITWRILGMSLQKTSSDDRSDPTVASAHLRSSSQDCSSRSSSRTKKGSEASRVRNRSNWRRLSELRRAGTRLPLGGTDRVSTPPPLRHRAPTPRPSQHRQQRVAPRLGRQRLRQRRALAWSTRQAGSGPRRRRPPPLSRWPPRQKSQPWEPAPQRRATPEPPAAEHPAKGSAERQDPRRR